jgi:hypothetical protein
VDSRICIQFIFIKYFLLHNTTNSRSDMSFSVPHSKIFSSHSGPLFKSWWYYFIFFATYSTTMHLLYTLSLLFILTALCSAQYNWGNQEAVNISYTANSSGAKTWLWSLVHLPANYGEANVCYISFSSLFFFNFIYLFIFVVSPSCFLSWSRRSNRHS